MISGPDDKRQPSRRKAAWAAYMRKYRARETPEEHEARLQKIRDKRAQETPEEQEERRRRQRAYTRKWRERHRARIDP